MDTSSQDELWVEFISGPRDGEIIQFTSSPVAIGRGQKADLRLSWDAKVAEQHARISRNDDGLTVERLGEQSDTFVDGQEVTDAVLLEDSSIVCVGRTEFVCRRDRTDQTKNVKRLEKTVDSQSDS